MFFIMAGGFYIASLLIKDGTADFKSVSWQGSVWKDVCLGNKYCNTSN